MHRVSTRCFIVMDFVGSILPRSIQCCNRSRFTFAYSLACLKITATAFLSSKFPEIKRGKKEKCLHVVEAALGQPLYEGGLAAFKAGGRLSIARPSVLALVAAARCLALTRAWAPP